MVDYFVIALADWVVSSGGAATIIWSVVTAMENAIVIVAAKALRNEAWRE